MMPNGYLQLALYIVVLLALAKPLGAYMARVYEGNRLALERVLGWLERLIYRVCGVTPDGGDGLEGLRRRHDALQPGRPARRLPAPAGSGRAPPEPPGIGRRLRGLLLQHGGELRHQHELAGVRRRDDDELSDPDAGPHRPELRLRRRRHGHLGRADSRPRPPLRPDHRQLLGGPHPLDALHPAAPGRSWARSCSSPRAWCRTSGPTKRPPSSSPSSTTSR